MERESNTLEVDNGLVLGLWSHDETTVPCA